jgi:ABC-type transport system involved in multi-copper enzyme maturation permease subunit
MKFLAFLKDSLRETIDSKVFFVVLAISALAVFVMATLSLEPNSPDEGFKKLVDRLPDGAQEVDVPVLGRIKATPSFTQFSLQDLQGPETNSRPWDAEYHFVIESRDLIPMGARMAILQDLLKSEDARARRKDPERKTRGRQLEQDINEEVQRIQERESKKGAGRMETQKRIQEQALAYISKRLNEEAQTLTNAEMEEFIKAHLEDQGNWRVTEVKLVDLPDSEKKIKVKTQVPIQEGEDIRIKTEEAEGEVNKFRITVVSQSGTYRLWPHKATLFFGAIPIGSSGQPGQLVYNIATYGIGWVGAPAIMLLSCIITSFYIPNMLRKGTIDLLLAKPINRAALLLYKYVGGLTFMFLNTSVLIGGLWIALGLRSDIWEPAFLVLIPVLTFEFALFYALSTLAAVWTRSPIVSILLCVVLWAILFGLGVLYAFTNLTKEAKGRGIPAWVYNSADVAHAALPHYRDLDELADKAIKVQSLSPSAAERENIEKEYEHYRWPETILVTFIYIVLIQGIACWWFWIKDY